MLLTLSQFLLSQKVPVLDILASMTFIRLVRIPPSLSIARGPVGVDASLRPCGLWTRPPSLTSKSSNFSIDSTESTIGRYQCCSVLFDQNDMLRECGWNANLSFSVQLTPSYILLSEAMLLCFPRPLIPLGQC